MESQECAYGDFDSLAKIQQNFLEYFELKRSVMAGRALPLAPRRAARAPAADAHLAPGRAAGRGYPAGDPPGGPGAAGAGTCSS